MKPHFSSFTFLIAVLLLASCGKDNPSSTEPDPPAPPGNPNTVSKDMGADGGEIISSDGLLTLTIPQGALVNTETITITPLEADELDSEFDQLVALEGISEVYELGPDGLEFDQPVVVSFSSNQASVKNNDTLTVFSEVLFTSSDGTLELLDSLQTTADFDNGTVTVKGQLSHFSPLVTSQSNNGVSFSVVGVPDMLEMGSSFTADARILGSDAGPLGDLVTVPGPAMYEDRSGTPIVPASGSPSGELPGNSTDGFTGTFDYTCNDLGLGIYQSDLSVQVIFNLDSGEIPAESFANFLTTVNCVEEMPASFDLQIALEGNGSGSVSSVPTGIDCPDDCQEAYNEGTAVTLTATPDEGSEFIEWSDDIADNAPQDSVITITMDQARNVTATFAEQQVQTFTLTVQKDGDGTGTVTSDPPGIDYGSDNMEEYNEDTDVTLTATPDQGSEFVMWSGDIGSGNNPESTSIQIKMDQARSVTATFEVEQPVGTTGVFPSGTNFPQGISFIPNPWGLLSFNSNCAFLLVVAGSDLAIVDPCSGNTLAVLDITFEISSTGLNGLIPLLPIEDSNGVTRNWLLLTTQSGWLNLEIVLDVDGNPQMGEIRKQDSANFIWSVSGTGGKDGADGGTNSAVIVDIDRGNIIQEKSDPAVPGTYDGDGKTLLSWIVGTLPGPASVAYQQSDDNDTPGDITGIARINGINRVFTSSYNTETGEYNTAVTGEAVVGDDVRDMDCVENPNSNTNEAEVLCITANLGGESISLILKMEDNSVQVTTENFIDAPIAIDAELTPNGNVQVLIGSILNVVKVLEYDLSSGNLINEADITLPQGVNGLTDVRFDPQNPGRGFASFQNSDNYSIFEF